MTCPGCGAPDDQGCRKGCPEVKPNWEFFCEHANENPNVCPCPPTCGCRHFHCKNKSTPRKLNNSRFHIANGQLVKTSNGQPIPPDEPTFILRGRDYLALPTLVEFSRLMRLDGCNEQFEKEVEDTIKEFQRFRDEHPDKMKQPGITRGR